MCYDSALVNSMEGEISIILIPILDTQKRDLDHMARNVKAQDNSSDIPESTVLPLNLPLGDWWNVGKPRAHSMVWK